MKVNDIGSQHADYTLQDNILNCMRFIKLALAGRALYMRYISVLLTLLVNPFIIPLLSYVSDLPVHFIPLGLDMPFSLIAL